ncbi:hypothetical protein PTTG_10938, partial [Puccinia triticina 1-1 BBBD Race 1]|uniref:Uncharacterized protein n=1 Tax=Puccinia triticina (isolate 1-1 / race 1 (BBBD)) TaxID=630390 RepID=A0A0C4FCI4_PUCT1
LAERASSLLAAIRSPARREGFLLASWNKFTACQEGFLSAGWYTPACRQGFLSAGWYTLTSSPRGSPLGGLGYIHQLAERKPSWRAGIHSPARREGFLSAGWNKFTTSPRGLPLGGLVYIYQLARAYLAAKNIRTRGYLPQVPGYLLSATSTGAGAGAGVENPGFSWRGTRTCGGYPGTK